MILSSEIIQDTYTQYVCDKYDIQDRAETTTQIADFPIKEMQSFAWNVGLIVGNSGGGKSTILNTIARAIPTAQPIRIEPTKAIVSQFANKEPQEVCDLFCSIGLSSVPTWLRRYSQLSNGEKARFDIASLIANRQEGEIILIDEYTSLVNRNVAKSMSYSLQRYARMSNLQIVLASCHFDIVEWLTPDWVFNLNKDAELERIRYKNDYSMLNVKTSEVLSNARDICQYK